LRLAFVAATDGEREIVLRLAIKQVGRPAGPAGAEFKNIFSAMSLAIASLRILLLCSPSGGLE
jgi:hypothetical protein